MKPKNNNKPSQFILTHLWQAAGLVMAIVSVVFTYLAYSLQTESEAKKLAHISYVALPVAERLPNPDLHRIYVTLANEGPATASLFIASYSCPSQFLAQNCKPIVLREPAGGSVEIKALSTPGHYQFVVKSLAPGDGAHLAVLLTGNEDPVKYYQAFMVNHANDKQFGRKYIGSFMMNGENIAFVNGGPIDDLLQ
jgi:hypothetical protein